jgi:hypothetical protein
MVLLLALLPRVEDEPLSTPIPSASRYYVTSDIALSSRTLLLLLFNRLLSVLVDGAVRVGSKNYLQHRRSSAERAR